MLSAEVLAEIVASIEDAGPSRIRRDKRRAPRVGHQGKVLFVPLGEASRKAVSAPIRNFSCRGISILHAKPMDNGSQFILFLSGREGQRLSILCTVVHRSRLSDNLYSIGAEFVCVCHPAG